jgi:hypothetical protein
VEPWTEVILVATEAITRDPKDAQIYFHGPFALDQVQKIQVQTARRLRRAVGLLVGERQFAKLGMEEMDDERSAKAVEASEAKPMGIQLGMTPHGK